MPFGPQIYDGRQVLFSLRDYLPKIYVVDFDPASDVAPNLNAVTSVYVEHNVGPVRFKFAEVVKLDGNLTLRFFEGVSPAEVRAVRLAIGFLENHLPE